MKYVKGSLIIAVLLLLVVGAILATPAQARVRTHVDVFVWGSSWPWYWPYYPSYPHGYYPGYPPYPEGYYAAPTIGYIKTDVQPDEAEVYVDGKKVGIADDYDGWPSYLKITPGKHQLIFKLQGYDDLTLDLDVAAGRLYRVDYKLFKAGEAPPVAKESKAPAAAAVGGSLHLRLNPADATVLVDGAPAGTAAGETVELQGLSAGKHKIEVKKEGYKSFSFEITVEDGSDHSLGVTLKKTEAEKPM